MDINEKKTFKLKNKKIITKTKDIRYANNFSTILTLILSFSGRSEQRFKVQLPVG